MKRSSTALALAVRLALGSAVVAQAVPLPLAANADALTETDVPALPSSFYGTAALDGADVAKAISAV